MESAFSAISESWARHTPCTCRSPNAVSFSTPFADLFCSCRRFIDRDLVSSLFVQVRSCRLLVCSLDDSCEFCKKKVSTWIGDFCLWYVRSNLTFSLTTVPLASLSLFMGTLILAPSIVHPHTLPTKLSKSVPSRCNHDSRMFLSTSRTAWLTVAATRTRISSSKPDTSAIKSA
jgi:hypothetical protein